MKVVVDANIIISVFLSPTGTIGEIIFNPNPHFEFITPNYLKKELKKHRGKIRDIAGIKENDIDVILEYIDNRIQFINEDSIGEEVWEKAIALTKDIDEKDIPYIACALYFQCNIWTGDKKLIKGLVKKDFNNFLDTAALRELISKADK